MNKYGMICRRMVGFLFLKNSIKHEITLFASWLSLHGDGRDRSGHPTGPCTISGITGPPAITLARVVASQKGKQVYLC